ncbi:SusC/RagA family TonB-linked outer membrane protein [Chitinophaga tropicalis]|uniref:SusC/RagA family TonB-linked outer membrane protein n=1 Tax=Chitinophaga tropicalis TaxID=2683588 RepID=A0A7K1U371_9BACT|nr:SusC/RagA family TonB-linked outer membrane protein [Chitinophaga tropicalis]MVT08812.1 SusC/RagA family TonB-linked outer membrane protein [Chitinophaga tropicalis]
MRFPATFLTALLCIITTLAAAQTVSISAKSAPVEDVISSVQKQTGYIFLYQKRVLADARRINVEAKDMSIREFLSRAFKDQPFNWSIEGKTIVLEQKKTPVIPSERQLSDGDTIVSDLRVTGRVVNANGEPVALATVIVKGSGKGVTTNEKGNFILWVNAGDVLEVTSIGYEKQQYRVRSSAGILIELKESVTALKDVVATGIVTRKAESFTGSAITVTKEELFKAGNQNVLQSLKNIDPSFRLVENLEMGSDPNRMPEIVMRGRSAMPDLTGTYSGNPNQPLFILDGFETTLQRVYDLDMNRIKSITLLKDAAAKAIYGAKAGNGVVVIETIQPQRGKLRLSYTSNINIEAPDLTGYNLMNAKEKLQFEKDHDMYIAGWDAATATAREKVYNQRYQDVYLRGVNTYWLSKPLQTGVGQRHSVFLEGGDDYMRYGATFFYNGITGAMKGSDRKTYSGNTTLSYRYRNLLFRNSMDIAQNTGHNSPYGNFSDYIKLNPYWTPYDENGNVKRIAGFYPTAADSTYWDPTYNPLYNATLNVINKNSYTQVIDNFYVEWNARKGLRFKGSIGYTYQKNGSDNFRPPGHTDFTGYTQDNGLINYKGQWIKSYGSSQSIESNIGADYTYITGRHFLLANVTMNINDIKSNINTFVAEGFGSDNVSDISMASYYQRASAPGGNDNHTRSIGVVGIMNYAYDNRFLFDASYRTNGSSIYGANSRWGDFWSLGIGWNLHNELFLKRSGLFQQFRLRGSMGYTGSQNADSYLTLATYNYSGIVYDGIKGATLMALPNPNLSWQKNLDYNGGVDLAVFKNKLSVRVDVYRRVTSNLLQDISAPPSFGFNTFRANIGKTVNTGTEIALRYQVFNNAKNRAYLNVSVTGTRNKNKLQDIADAFRSYNETQDSKVTDENVLYTRPVARYYEGQSMTAIWAMKSLGIDPSSGNELFMTKDGKLTYTWSANDLVIAGDTEAKIYGTYGINAGYKGFNLSLICSYRIGGQLYNSTLVERVENINGRMNLDRRIKNAWTKTGDVAIYRKPQVSSAVNQISYTKPTSRFIQENSELYFSTINLSYDVLDRRLLQKLGMDRLRFTFYTNELLRISSITTERGTTYPFARNYSFSLQTTF